MLAIAVALAAALPSVAATQAGYNITFNGQVIFCKDTPRICEEGGSGTFLPGDDEYKWSKGGRIVLYGLILCYFFAGVALLADAFMNSIETITAKERVLNTVDFHGRPVQFSVRIWNPTVANLTLMALGSSAPEIILSIIEVIFNDFYSGDLGPGTIVGSAAFNLFIIVGVCSFAVGMTVKRIDSMGVFTVTAIFAVLAYVWLIVILEGTSPNAIEIWEAVLTLAFFPLLVVIAYFLDKRKNRANQVTPNEDVTSVTMIDSSPHGHHAAIVHNDITKIQEAERTGDLDQEAVERAVVKRAMESQGHIAPSRAYYRRLAKQNRFKKKANRMSIHVGRGVHEYANVASEVGFQAAAYVGVYGSGAVEVIVVRDGKLDQPCAVVYETEDDVAVSGTDYEATSGKLTFAAGEKSKVIVIPILNVDEESKMVKALEDDIPDDTLIVRLVSAELTGNAASATSNLVALRNNICTVHLASKQNPGCIQLACADIRVLESQKYATVKVLRIGGTKGTVTVNYATKDGTAIATKDYHECKGTFTFGDGEVEKTMTINIIDDDVYEKDEVFFFTISEPTGGAGLGRVYKATITIVNDDEMTSKLDKLKSLLRINEDRVNQVTEKWTEQFSDALEQPQSGLLSVEGVCWMAMLPWGLVVALLPPATIAGGWLLFTLSLACTGIVTALIGDYASLLGCVIGLSDYVTAITIVALGTSLPDTFASVLAAKTDDHADAAIVNVTGSNSVNVFLGLGVAWLIGAVYWEGNATEEWKVTVACKDPSVVENFPNGVFFVKAGTISLSVAVYAVCATTSLLTLYYNRLHIGGELGGPKRRVFLAFQIVLWGIYICMSALKSENII